MVGWLTYGNKKFESLDSQMRCLIPPLRQAMLDFIPMIDADTNAFSGFMVKLSPNCHATIRNCVLLLYRPWQTRTHCCGDIVAHDVSWARDTKRILCFHVAQTGKRLLQRQNVSEQNPKHFFCPGHKICVRNKCCARGQTGKHLCRQQCVRNNVSCLNNCGDGGSNVKNLHI